MNRLYCPFTGMAINHNWIMALLALLLLLTITNGNHASCSVLFDFVCPEEEMLMVPSYVNPSPDNVCANRETVAIPMPATSFAPSPADPQSICRN